MAEFLEYLALIVCSVYEWHNMHGITGQPCAVYPEETGDFVRIVFVRSQATARKH